MDKFVTSEEVISTARILVPEIDDSLSLLCRQLVYLGVRELGPILEDIKDCVLYPHDNALKKPEDCLIIDDIALFDATGNELAYTYRGPGKGVHKDFSTTFSVPIDISEDDWFIHFGSNGDYVATAAIRYYGLPIDEYGDIRIPERWLLPLSHFIRYMLAIRLDNGKEPMAREVWKEERRKAKSVNKTVSHISPLAMRTLDKKYNSMINKIMHSRF